MAGFYPSDKVASDFNGGQEWRDGIDGIAASDLNNIVELLLHLKQSSGGTKKLYRHEIEIAGYNHDYDVYLYITLYNSDPTDYSYYEYDEELGEGVPLAIDDVLFLPDKQYIKCSGYWNGWDEPLNIAQQVRRFDSNLDLAGIGDLASGGSTVLGEIPIDQFHMVTDSVMEITL